MGLISKTATVNWNSRNKNFYNSQGYVFTKMKDKLEVDIKDLQEYASASVTVKCDCCNKIINMIYPVYLRGVKEDGKYFCNKCALKLYGKANEMKTKLANGKSFEQWCIENKRQEILKYWDYELNDCKPSEISYGTKKKYWFKCPRGLHESELKSIINISTMNVKYICNKCDSIAQYLIDTYGENALNLYWDYDKNTVDPWTVHKNNNRLKLWLKCQNKNYHIYNISSYCFVEGIRCGYCNGKKVHPLDSLGKLLENLGLLHLWSAKNDKSPYEYSPNSGKKVWLKCAEGKHEDYYRSVNNSNIRDFRCPECQFSKGEDKINNYLIKNNIYKIPQKEFDGLLGLGSKNLSYDFCLPQYNLLIEYQGEQHEKYIKGFHKSEKDFKKQIEHDRRKKEYAEKNNIKLLEIWYYDFDNIEMILDKELNMSNNDCKINNIESKLNTMGEKIIHIEAKIDNNK
jgi:hypothetical protein